MSHQSHHDAAKNITARCAIVTLSDTRTPATDTSGDLIRRLLTQSHHTVTRYEVLKEDPTTFEPRLLALLADEEVDALITNGGTGVARRDHTFPAIEKLLDQPLPGFGELFRMLSFQQVGPAAMLSRATAGIARGKPVFALPGSPKAVDLALTQLILPELPHLLHELRK